MIINADTVYRPKKLLDASDDAMMVAIWLMAGCSPMLIKVRKDIWREQLHSLLIEIAWLLSISWLHSTKSSCSCSNPMLVWLWRFMLNTY